MRAFYILLTKELRSFFLSPLAYVLVALFTFLNGWLFISMLKSMQMRVSTRSLVHNLFSSGWFWMGFFILFPLITMRLFAEERKMGTIEGLLTAPVRTAEVVLSKYCATMVVYLVIILPLFLFFPLFHLVTGEDAAFHSGAFWGSALGLFLVGLFNVAIGTLASSLTTNQLIAAMVTFVFVMLHYFLGFLQYFGMVPGSIWTEGITYFSTTEHMNSLTEGLIDSRPVVYYLSFSAVLLALTHHVLESRKWRV
ncbi:MAG: ABC transporter permease [Verrucomicrobiales bacterium]